MTSSRRLLVRTGLAAAAALVVTSCGSGGTITMVRGDGVTLDGVTLASLQTAGTATAEATSGRFESTVTLGGRTFMTSTGEFSGDRSHASSRMDFEAMGSAFGADGSGTSEGSGLGDLGFDASMFDSEIVVDGSTGYLRGGMLAQMTSMFGVDVPEGGWLRVSGEELGAEGDTSVTGATGAEAARLLSGAVGEVTTIGTEEVRGVATTHSRVDVDPAKVAGDVIDQLPVAKDTRFTADVWIGDDGLVHRLRFSVSMADVMGAALGGGDGLGSVFGGSDSGSGDDAGAPEMAITYEMWDVGAAIDIAVPDPSQVVDAPAGLGGK